MGPGLPVHPKYGSGYYEYSKNSGIFGHRLILGNLQKKISL